MTKTHTPEGSSKLRVHNQYDREVAAVLIKQHPEWTMEVIREAALIASNTIIDMQTQREQTTNKELYAMVDRFARGVAVAGMQTGFSKTIQKMISPFATQLEAYAQSLLTSKLSELLEKKERMYYPNHTGSVGAVPVEAINQLLKEVTS